MRERVYLPAGTLRRFRLRDTPEPRPSSSFTRANIALGLGLWLVFSAFLFWLSSSDGWQARAADALGGKLFSTPGAEHPVTFGAIAGGPFSGTPRASATGPALTLQSAPMPSSATTTAPAAAVQAPTRALVTAAEPLDDAATDAMQSDSDDLAPREPQPPLVMRGIPLRPVIRAERRGGALEPVFAGGSADEEAARAAPAAAAPPPRIADTRALPGCEALRNRQTQSVDMTQPRAPSTDGWQQRARALLADGSYFAHCGLGASTALTLCTAVEQGRVVGVSVTTEPASASVNACVRRAVSNLRFSRSPELEVFTTRFARLR